MAVLRTLLWLAFLFLTTLPWLAIGSGRLIELGSPVVTFTLTTLIAAAGVGTFLWKASPQRGVLVLYFLSLCGLGSSRLALSVPQLAAHIATITFLAIVIEIVRQNLPLYRELVRSNAAVGKILGRSVGLWAPMVLFIALGVWLNLCVGRQIELLAYNALPIDEYCEFEDRHEGLIFPCSELGATLEGVHPVDLRELVRSQVHRRFVDAKIKVSNMLAEAPLADPEALERLARQVIEELWPARVLDPDAPRGRFGSIGGNDVPLYLARQATDVAHATLMQQQRTFPNPDPQGSLARLQLRQREIFDQARQDLKQDEALQNKELRVHLLMYLGSVIPQVNPARPILGAKDHEAGRAALTALRKDAFNDLDRLEAETLRRMEIYLFSEAPLTGTLAFPPGVVEWFDHRDPAMARVRKDPVLFTSILKEVPQCTTLRPGTTYTQEEIAKLHESRPGQAQKTWKDLKPASVNRQWFNCPGNTMEGARIRSLGLQESIRRSLAFNARQEVEAFDRSFQEKMLEVRQAGADLQAVASAGLGLVDNSIDLGREKCRGGIFPPSHCIANYIKERAEEGYHDAVTRMKRETDRVVEDTKVTSVSEAEDQLVAARANMYLTYAAGVAALEGHGQKVFNAYNIFSALAWLFLALSVLKSYLYVVATEIFNRDEYSKFAVRPDQEDILGSYVTSSEVRFRRSGTTPGDKEPPSDFFDLKLLTKGHATNQGASMRFFLCNQPFTAILTRIRHSVYFVMNFASYARGADVMYFTANGNERIVHWKLKENEQVVVSYAELLAVSENVVFGSFVSLQLSTLLLGRFVFHTATCTKGSGRLLLRAKADSNSEDIQYVPLDRIAAWNSQVRFHVNSEVRASGLAPADGATSTAGQRHVKLPSWFQRRWQRVVKQLDAWKALFIDGNLIGPVRSDDGRHHGLVVVRPGSDRLGLSALMRFVRTFVWPF